MLTDQDAFDTTVRFMRDPNFEQCLEDGVCVYYRSRDGRRCAIGNLLSVSTAKAAAFANCGSVQSALTGNSAIELTIQSELAGVNPDLLQKLQDLHDDWNPDCDLEERIQWVAEIYNRETAEEYKLTVPDGS